jgi:protein-disulfide isomerase
MRFSFLALCVVLAAVSVQAQAPIPYRPDGYQIGGPVSAPIVFDAFVDLLCPDCAAAWPNIKAVTDHYGSNISVVLHTFPLPYHTLGFTIAQAAHVIIDQEPSIAREFGDFMFGTQSVYWNSILQNSTTTQVLAQLTEQVVSKGFVSQEVFTAGMADDNINEETRVSWKFACSKGVLGTPTFFVNGVNIPAADPTWTLSDWQILLDPLLQPQPPARKVAPVKPKCVQRKHNSHTHLKRGMTCPAGEPTCTYLPGKTQCCLPGEMCIPNVGCRC